MTASWRLFSQQMIPRGVEAGGEALASVVGVRGDGADLSPSSRVEPLTRHGDELPVAADADEQTVLTTAEKSEKLQPWIAGKSIKKKLYVPKKLVNFVVG